MSESEYDGLLPESEEFYEENPDIVAQEEQLPPDPSFLVVRNAFGPGNHSVRFPDGTPVGKWMRDQNVTGEQAQEMLVDAGLDPELAAWFGKQRDRGIAADAQIAAHPATQAFAAEEQRHQERLVPIREAFIKSRKGK